MSKSPSSRACAEDLSLETGALEPALSTHAQPISPANLVRIPMPELPSIGSGGWQGFSQDGTLTAAAERDLAWLGWLCACLLLIPSIIGSFFWPLNQAASWRLVEATLPFAPTHIWNAIAHLWVSLAAATGLSATHAQTLGHWLLVLITLGCWLQGFGKRRGGISGLVGLALGLGLLSIPGIGYPITTATLALVTWIAVTAHRASGERPDRAFGIVVGLFNGIMLAILPATVMVLIVLEAINFATARGRWKPIRTETVTAAFVALAASFAAMSQGITPSLSFTALSLARLDAVLPFLLLSLCLFALWRLMKSDLPELSGPLLGCLSAAGIGLILVSFSGPSLSADQLPVYAPALALTIAGLGILAGTQSLWISRLAGAGLVVVVCLSLATAPFLNHAAPIQDPEATEVRQIVAAEPFDKIVFVVSPDPVIATGIQANTGHKIHSQARSLIAEGPQANLKTWQADIGCTPPDLLIIHTPEQTSDPLDAMLQDPEFRAWFDVHYARMASRHARVFRPRLERPPAPYCPR